MDSFTERRNSTLTPTVYAVSYHKRYNAEGAEQLNEELDRAIAEISEAVRAIKRFLAPFTCVCCRANILLEDLASLIANCTVALSLMVLLATLFLRDPDFRARTSL